MSQPYAEDEIYRAVTSPYGYEVSCSVLFNYEFMGWSFKDNGLIQPRDSNAKKVGQLLLYKTIINPQPPEADLSYHCYSEQFQNREWAAAWLIAHWWEHALKMCPCQTEAEDAMGGNFRLTMIESLLLYHQDFIARNPS